MKRLLLLAALLASTTAFANDFDAFGFEKQAFTSSLSRAEVVADLKAAQEQGLVPVGELRLNAVDGTSLKSRAQVAAETREAARLGLLRNREIDPVQATPEQEKQIALAGLRAVGHSAAAE